MGKRREILSTPETDTVIGAGVKIKGALVSDGDILIDGSLNGEIKAAGSLHIGVNATIKANLTAANVRVSGQVDGDLKVSGETVLETTAKVKGNITTASLEIAPGAYFSGSSIMSGIETPREPAEDVTPEEHPVDK